MKTLKNSEKMSSLQFFMLIITIVVPFGHFVYINLAISSVGNDAWIALLIAGCIGLGIVYLQFFMALRHPDKSLTDYTLSVFGRLIGSLISGIYILLFIFTSSMTLHLMNAFMGMIYSRTPMIVFTICLLAISYWVVYEGIEVLSRVAQLVLPLLILLGLFATLLTLKDKHFNNLLPILHRPLLSLTTATGVFVMMFSEIILFSMMVLNTNNPKVLPKLSLVLVAVLTCMFLGPITGPVLIFGSDLAQNILFPTFAEIRYIEYSSVFERVDVIGIFLWIMGAYLRSSGYCFGATRGIANLLKRPDERKVAWLTIILIGGATITLDQNWSIEKTYDFLTHQALFLLPFIGIGLPLLTVCVDLMKTKFRHLIRIQKKVS